MRTRSRFTRALCLALAEVMAMTSLLWAAPPPPRRPGPVSAPTKWVEVEPPMVALARAFEELTAEAGRLEPVATTEAPEPGVVEATSPAMVVETLPRRIAAFAFGADTFTRDGYIKVVQNGSNFLYAPERGYGYVDLDGLDTSPNNRGRFGGADEIYDQFIGAKPGGSDIVFRVEVPNGKYRFVAAGGDAQYANHSTSMRVENGAGGAGGVVSLVEDFTNPNREFWQVGFDGNVPPPSSGPVFAPLAVSGTLEVSRGYLDVRQIAGTGDGIASGGDLCLLEIWLVEEAEPPVPTDPPEDLVHAFAFGADDFTLESPNAPGVSYTKVVQDGANFLYTGAQGFGYTDLSGLDTSLNDRGVLEGDAEIYDQFIGAKPGGTSIVFRIDLPNGLYRIVAAGGDAKYTDHDTSLRLRDGSTGTPIVLVDGLRNRNHEFYRIGFDGKAPPVFPSVNFLPLSASPFVTVTSGFLEVHQIAGEGASAGGDLSILEIWKGEPVIVPPDFVAAFAFGADAFTRESPNAPVPYTKVVQDGENFHYSAERGYGYTDLSGLDDSPNNRGVLDGLDEIYDQFIGAKGGTRRVVFRVDVPNGEYRFVAAGGDIQYDNHRTSVLVRDGSTGSFLPFVENLENVENAFYRVGFNDRHAPESSLVPFLPEVGSPTIAVTQGYLEVHQLALEPAPSGGDLSLLEIWQAGGGTGTPPTVAIELPDDGGFYFDADVAVRVRFTDADTIIVSLDGTPIVLDLTPGLAEGQIAPPDGMHTLEVVATNPAGTVSASHVFTVDTTPPVVELTPPPAFVNQTPLVVSGTVHDRDPATSVACPDVVLTLEHTTPDGVREWSFTCAFELQEGANTLQVTASDSGGRQASDAVAVTLDTEAPSITVTAPTEDTYSMTGTVDVSGGVFDDSPVTVRVENGSGTSLDATVTGTQFSAPGVSLGAPSSGDSVALRVIAEDAAGNAQEAAVTVFFDNTAPVVTLDAPDELAVVASPITVSGTVTDPAPVVLVDVNGSPVMTDVDTGSFTTTLTSLDGDLTIVARAIDAAGNEGSAEVRVTVDSTPPMLTLTAPDDGTVTNLNPILVDGSVVDATPVTLRVNGVEAGSDFPLEASLDEGENTISVSATDAAGNLSSASRHVVLDTFAPTLTIASPDENEVVGLPLFVQGTVEDATAVTVTVNGVVAARTLDAWTVDFDDLPEEAQELVIVATDAAGNPTSATRNVFVDSRPPVIAITSPATNVLTNAADIDVSGTVVDSTATTVTVAGVPATVVSGTFVATVTLSDGDNVIDAVATDARGQSAEARVIVTQDAIPPTVDLVTPDTVSGITPGEAAALASDNLELDHVTFEVDGTEAGSFTAPPFRIDLTVPDGFDPGDTFVVRVEAHDTAGNATAVSRGVRVIENGVVVGQVLDDTTSLPIEGATVTLGTRSVLTTADGEYSIPTGDAEVVLKIEKDGMTAVERRTSVLSDVGTVPVDARLTPVGRGAPELTIDADPASFTLTALSPQGLPALLPLGWSPLRAFEISLGGVAAHVSGIEPTEVDFVHVVRYRATLHEWVMVEPSLLPAGDVVSFVLPEPGAYALVVADEGLPLPGTGEMLEGVAAVNLPASATAEGVVDPPILPPSGGTAEGSLAVFSPVPLPSGTVVQAEITESFTLASGDVASRETRLEDIVLFQAPSHDPDGSLFARFPIASAALPLPDDTDAVVSGEVSLDILAGREGVRGERAGSRAANVEEGDFGLAVPSAALPEDTAVDLQTFDGFSEFVPTEPTLDPLGEVFVDFSGRRLALGAELSFGMAGLSPDDTYVLARVTRIDGVPEMEFVGRATLNLAADENRLSTAGIRDEGRYVFFRVAGPTGFVAGTTSAPGAVVETTGLPFVALANETGAYRTLALTGPVTVTAFVPRTSLRATGDTNVVADETSNVDLTLTGQVTTATVTPANGALGVSLSVQIDVVATQALDPLSLDVLRLLDATGAPVPTRVVLSVSRRSLAVIPGANLAPETLYKLEAATVADVYGGAVTIPETSFTTRPEQALTVDATNVTLSLPDDDGIVQISGAALPPGASVLLVNAGNGIVLSLTVDNDGNLAGELPATISDRILITVTDPAGNVASFEKSKFVGPDGVTAVGAGGGTVEGAGGVALRIPEGALDQGATFKIEAFDETFLPTGQAPDLPESNFGAGLEVTAESMPTFAKEVDLVFPKPTDAPDGAFYYVYRKFETDTGIVQWETIDHAFVEDDKVVTASYPFGGYTNSFSAIQSTDPRTGFPVPRATSVFMMVWTLDPATLHKAKTGLVTGKVLRTVFRPASSVPTFEPIPNVPVYGVIGFGKDNGTFAISQEDGTYTFFDEQFRDGLIRVRADVEGITQEATAYNINVKDDGPVQFQFYENVATANLTFPPKIPEPEPPTIEVVLFRKTVDGGRERTKGLVLQDDVVIIGLVTKDVVQRVTINGEVFGVRGDPDPAIDLVMDHDFVPGRVGTFTIEVTALAADGRSVNEKTVFRSIAAGGGNDDVVNDAPPAVIDGFTVPSDGARSVPIDILPQVSFSEPVTNVIGGASVTLTDSLGVAVDFTLSGVAPGGGVIPDISSAGAVVTSLTLQPLVGLRYGETYTLNLTPDIVDLDTDVDGNAAPKPLEEYTSRFTTFGPETLGGTSERFGSAGIVVMDERAYLVENHFFNGTLRVFDVADPVEPFELVDAQAFVEGRPVDIAGEPGIVAIATGPTNQSRPSNLYFFDVTHDDASPWVGVASVARSAPDGFIQRVDLLDGLAYVLTGRKGVQIVDVQAAIDGFQSATGGEPFTPGYFDVLRKLNTAGLGFGESAVGQAIRLIKSGETHWVQNDLSVHRMGGDVWAGTTGEASLLMVNAITREVLAPVPLEVTSGPPDDFTKSISFGTAIELGTVGARDLALVGGWRSAGAGDTFYGLAVVDLSNPRAPTPLDIVELPLTSSPTDILLNGDIAIVASQNEAALVSLSNPVKPVLVGLIDGIGGVLAMTQSNLLLSSARSTFGEDTEQSGIKVAALGRVGLVGVKGQNPFGVDNANLSEVALDLDFRVAPADLEIESAVAELVEDGSVLTSLDLVRSGSTWTSNIPKGSPFDPDRDYSISFVVNRGLENETASQPKRLRPAKLELTDTLEAADPDSTDLIPLYNPTPKLELDPVADPGSGRRVQIVIGGDVTSSLAPISVASVDGKFVPVNQRQTGAPGTGPFEGHFAARVDVGPQETLILVHVANALGNLTTGEVLVTPIFDGDGKITGRQITRNVVSTRDVDVESYRFHVELKDRGVSRETVRVEIDTGDEPRVITLQKAGLVFRSDPLLLVPSNLKLPPDTEAVSRRLLLAKMGAKPRIRYAENVTEEGIVEGALLVNAQSMQPLGLVDPSPATHVKQQVAIAVGASGTNGPTMTVSLDSLREDLTPASPTSPLPFSQTIQIARQSDDEEQPGYNYYLTREPVVPVYAEDGADFPGATEHGVIASTYLRVSASSSSDIVPVGIPADMVEWFVVAANPRFKDGPPDPATESTHLEFFDIIVSARLKGLETGVPGLLVGFGFDPSGDVADESSTITPVVAVGNEFQPVAFPARTGDDGSTLFRIRMRPASQPSLSVGQSLKGIEATVLDPGGGTLLELLETLQEGGDRAIALESLLVRSGRAPPDTPLVHRKAEAGLPQGLQEFGGRIAREVLFPLIQLHPTYAVVSEIIRQGFANAGIPLSSDMALEYANILLAGALLGLPLGFLHAGVESLRLLRNTLALIDLLVLAAKGLFYLQIVRWKVAGGIIQFVIDDEYREEITNRLAALAPHAVALAQAAVNPQIIAAGTVFLGSLLYESYESNIGSYVPFLTGLPRGSDGEKLYIVGFMLGHLLGFLIEIGIEIALGAVFVVAAVGFVGAAAKLARLRRVTEAYEIIGQLKLGTYRGTALQARIGKILIWWFQFINGLDDASLLKALAKVDDVADVQHILRLIERYGADFEEIADDGRYLTPGIEKLISALRQVDEPGEVAVLLGRLIDPEFRAAGRPIFVAFDNLEDIALALDRLVKVAKRGINTPGRIVPSEALLAGLDNVLRHVDDIGPFLLRLADTGDGALAALAKLEPPPGGVAVRFESIDDAIAEFLATVSARWDAESFTALDGLISRWATTQPPPIEAFFDIITMIAKYGRTAAAAGADAGASTRRIVLQLQRFGENADDVVRQLILLDKSFVTGSSSPNLGLTRVDLDWLARNMEAGGPDVGLGADTSIVEGLVRYSRINSNEDDVTGPASTILREMQREAGATDASTNLVNKVKGTLANKEVLDGFQAAGHHAGSDVGTLGGKFLDTVVTLESEHRLTVLTLDASGNVVTAERVYPPGTVLTIETKSLSLDTWADPRQIDKLVNEVDAGFIHLESIGRADDYSHAAVSADLLANEVRLRSVLRSIRDLDGGPRADRAELIILSRPSVGSNSYGSQARGIIRNLQQ